MLEFTITRFGVAGNAGIIDRWPKKRNVFFAGRSRQLLEVGRLSLPMIRFSLSSLPWLYQRGEWLRVGFAVVDGGLYVIVARLQAVERQPSAPDEIHRGYNKSGHALFVSEILLLKTESRLGGKDADP